MQAIGGNILEEFINRSKFKMKEGLYYGYKLDPSANC